MPAQNTHIHPKPHHSCQYAKMSINNGTLWRMPSFFIFFLSSCLALFICFFLLSSIFKPVLILLFTSRFSPYMPSSPTLALCWPLQDWLLPQSKLNHGRVMEHATFTVKPHTHKHIHTKTKASPFWPFLSRLHVYHLSPVLLKYKVDVVSVSPANVDGDVGGKAGARVKNEALASERWAKVLVVTNMEPFWNKKKMSCLFFKKNNNKE